jgi:hypothetical protein
VELEGRTVAVYVTREGFAQLNFLLGLEVQDEGAVGLVRSADSFGIWLSLAGNRWARILIVPWGYVRAIEVEPETDTERQVTRRIGFQA